MVRGLLILLSLLTATSAARPLPFFYDLYTFRGESGRTKVVAAFAVPVERLQRERHDGETRYRFDLTLVIADTAIRTVSRVDDSVYVSVPRPLSGEHLLHTYLEVEAPPSHSTLHRVVMTDATTPGIGQLYDSPFPIPDYSGTELMLSDIALGRPNAASGWKRGDVRLALLPTSQFPEGSFDVYYEIYNLPTGSPYTTEISIQPLDGAGQAIPGTDRTVTRFSLDAASRPDGTLGELRALQTSLGKGRYRLRVAVTDDATGRTATRSRTFRVRGWGEGATLVHALPRRGPGG